MPRYYNYQRPLTQEAPKTGLSDSAEGSDVYAAPAGDGFPNGRRAGDDIGDKESLADILLADQFVLIQTATATNAPVAPPAPTPAPAPAPAPIPVQASIEDAVPSSALGDLIYGVDLFF